jgi:hypothetical protein
MLEPSQALLGQGAARTAGMPLATAAPVGALADRKEETRRERLGGTAARPDDSV